LTEHLRKVAAFTRPTFLRFAVLALAAVLTLGGRTVCNLLRTVGLFGPGHPSSYHRVFSRRRWSAWRLAQALVRWLLRRLLPSGPVYLAGDDTVEELECEGRPGVIAFPVKTRLNDPNLLASLRNLIPFC
jgi:hypothetical protein